MHQIENIQSKILLVDDEPIALDIYKGIFEDVFDIATAANGREALLMVPLFNPDVIVLDAMMPEIDGWEVCRILKSDTVTQSIKIIMVSANAVSSNDRKSGYAVGADDYIVKPFIHEDIYEKVHVWSRLKKSEDKLKQRICELESAKH